MALSRAEISARQRARRRRDERIYGVALTTTTLHRLVETGRLTDEDLENDERVAAAIATIIDEHLDRAEASKNFDTGIAAAVRRRGIAA